MARAIRARADRAAAGFLQPDLAERLTREREASKQGGTKVYRIANSLRSLSEELALLSVASGLGAAVDGAVWEAARRDVVPMTFALERVVFHGRNHQPPWNADLWTADIGMSLAIALHAQCPALDAGPTEDFIREKCLRPILADWLDDDTRLHSFDSMGHNWWSVLVGGAGVMAAVLGDEATARRIADNLRAWAAYPGSALSRKQGNFGPDGDFVEGFSYGQYALMNPCAFSYFYQSYRLVPDVIDVARARGMADWLKSAFVPTDAGPRLAASAPSADGSAASVGGWHPQRFGDVKFYDYQPRADLWHTLGEAVDDPHLVDLAHRIKPAPDAAMEMLLWRPRPRELPPAAPVEPLKLYARSGLAMLRRGGQRVTVRAGEFWNHNHLDAGTFIYHEDDAVWIDDCGVCAYSLPQYMEHYVRPSAHNVAFAPALVPPIRRAFLESLPHVGRYLCLAADESVSVVCVDTNILGVGALMRSYRWFIDLGGEAFVVWDDLSGHAEQVFESRLHTTCAVERAGDQAVLRQGARSRRTFVYCDAASELAVEPAEMGEEAHDGAHRAGHALVWRTTAAALRVKFALAMGGRLKSAEWAAVPDEASAHGGGWQCVAQTQAARWLAWFNPQADGRVMHVNCISPWQGIQTDAYALLRREAAGRATLWAIHGSFVRRDGGSLHAATARQPLTRIDLGPA